MRKNIFIFDMNKCVGCHACVVACMNENGFQFPEQWRNIHKSSPSHFPHLPLFYLSLACNHCEEAPCLKNCPAQAYSRDEKTGAIIHHSDKCIGCKYCTWACPYDAPKFNPAKGIIEKCTFCNHRIEDNLKPACANLCPVGALDFNNTEFSREESLHSSPVPVNVGSGIKINTLRNNTGPEIDQNLFLNQPKHIKTKETPKISAAKEWALILFTLLSAILVSVYASGIVNNIAHKILYLGAGAIAAVLSILHLGKKFRAWRSLSNIKNSWLSREIAMFSIFFTLVFIDFFLFDLPNIITALIGILYLFSIDMLYKLANWRWPVKIHPAQTLFIGISLYALFIGRFELFTGIILFRIILYLYRKSKSEKANPIGIILRLALWIAPVITFYLDVDFYLTLSILLMGEILGRIEFYNELSVPEPGKEFIKNIPLK